MARISDYDDWLYRQAENAMSEDDFEEMEQAERQKHDDKVKELEEESRKKQVEHACDTCGNGICMDRDIFKPIPKTLCKGYCSK